MHIKKIKLTNFRNYEDQEVFFDKNINIFYGNNAQGKTNLLEAIYLCAIGKSYRTNRDKELVKEDSRYLTASVEYEKKDREGKISVNISEKKVIAVNDIKIKKMSEVLGNIN
ncbi:MAG: AAA family ATPase, partial [Clostridia bacterium]|nr:AAA family ATPase [Clostridia bacterium]